ncbi:juvenile hormone esterase isoform X2 [Nomia melanderi]|uniref:juvenile hormone esterase isoform X2 n=1 Tax=Nomia melanderi TaxID=2448451 RepID=UPI0013042FAA|nr:esterase FE4-like isoform X2 [Nomia melanderi]
MAREDPVVTVKQGRLRGTVQENVYGGQFLAFRGVPFAKPPIGPLRFKDPEPAEPWTGIKDATEYGNWCSQMDIFTREFIGDDDCLYLNVYTPTTEVTSKRAVMVWIHGGGFVNGSGDNTFYGPDYLIRKDIVLVTINYRLGIFGFLDLDDEVAPGNQGLKDQVLALKWVQENISSFGGDPNNVTIFGESAGGASVHYLCISPLAQGLFHKAIAQSGVSVNPWAINTRDTKEFAFQLAADRGLETKDPVALVEFLRTIDAKTLVTMHYSSMNKEKNFLFSGLFKPNVDRKSPTPFMPQHPAIIMKAGVKVPLLIGHNSNEGSLFLSNIEKVLQKVNANFDDIVHPETEAAMKKDDISSADLRNIYFGDKPITKETQQNYADYMSDMMFTQGIYDVLRIQMEKSTPTYFYKFTFEPEISFMKQKFNIEVSGASHAEELMFMFYSKLLKLMQINPPEPKSRDHNVLEYLTQMWTDFAKTGNPTPMTTNQIPALWKPLQKGDVYNYMNIGEKLRMETTKREEHTFDWIMMKNKL